MNKETLIAQVKAHYEAAKSIKGLAPHASNIRAAHIRAADALVQLLECIEAPEDVNYMGVSHLAKRVDRYLVDNQ